MKSEVQEFSAFSLIPNRAEGVRLLSDRYAEHVLVESVRSKERFWMPASELLAMNPIPVPKAKKNKRQT